jgi:hypothetical protein
MHPVLKEKLLNKRACKIALTAETYGGIEWPYPPFSLRPSITITFSGSETYTLTASGVRAAASAYRLLSIALYTSDGPSEDMLDRIEALMLDVERFDEIAVATAGEQIEAGDPVYSLRTGSMVGRCEKPQNDKYDSLPVGPVGVK